MQITSLRGISAVSKAWLQQAGGPIAAWAHTLLPSQCAVCRGWPAARVCTACVNRFSAPRPRCRTCAAPVAAGIVHCGECLVHPPALDACLAALDYAYPWIDLIAQFKFAPWDPGWARPLANLMQRGEATRDCLADAQLVLPIPLSRERLSERGFNQSLLLARALGVNEKISSDVLLRVRRTPAQSRLTRRERLRNLRTSFAIDPPHAHVLHGRRILLIDDVMTTGATLQTAALLLKRAGASEVRALVLAKTA